MLSVNPNNYYHHDLEADSGNSLVISHQYLSNLIISLIVSMKEEVGGGGRGKQVVNGITSQNTSVAQIGNTYVFSETEAETFELLFGEGGILANFPGITGFSNQEEDEPTPGTSRALSNGTSSCTSKSSKRKFEHPQCLSDDDDVVFSHFVDMKAKRANYSTVHDVIDLSSDEEDHIDHGRGEEIHIAKNVQLQQLPLSVLSLPTTSSSTLTSETTSEFFRTIGKEMHYPYDENDLNDLDLEANNSSQSNIHFTSEEAQCVLCNEDLTVGEGLVFQGCMHSFCRHCLSTKVENSIYVFMSCPYPDCCTKIPSSEFKQVLQNLEIRDLYNETETETETETATVITKPLNSFKCQTQGCEGWCYYDEGSKVSCPVCNKINCIPCQANHDGISCDEYQQEFKKQIDLGALNPAQEIQDFIEKKKLKSGFGQLAASFAKTVPDPGCDEPWMYNSMIDYMAETPVLISNFEFECIICYDDVSVGLGVILKECYHMFCKVCLISHVEHCEDAQVGCPHPGCTAFITPREIHALLPPEIMAKVTKRSWSLAEAIIVNKFHCLTVNCDGFCELEGVVNSFLCPLCFVLNCIRCNAIHEGVLCEDYQNRIVQSENDDLSAKAVENLIATGKAMRCPTCKTAVEKDKGCDGMTCTVCKTELCWATKGARWGPGGKGDISGGCRCKVNGRLCHPKCRHCH